MASSLRIFRSQTLTVGYTPAASGARGGAVECGAGTYSVTRENGTESTQCDRVYYIGGATVAPSTTNSYDAAGSLTQPDGTAFLPARLDYAWIRNTGTVPLYVGPHGTNGCGATVFTKALGDLVVCNPGKVVVLEGGVAGAVVAGGSTDIIAVENPSASVAGSYDFGMAGRSA